MESTQTRSLGPVRRCHHLTWQEALVGGCGTTGRRRGVRCAGGRRKDSVPPGPTTWPTDAAMREEKALSPQPCTAAKTDWKDDPMRSADATERAAGQRPKHWGSHVSPGAKPQRCSRPPAHTSKNGPFELPAQRSQRRFSEALFLCGAWTQDFLLLRNCWLNRAPCSWWGQGWRPGGRGEVGTTQESGQ